MVGNPKNKISAEAQILKGKAQEALGEFQSASGDAVKGGISKAKGKLNQAIGGAKKNWENSKDSTGRSFDEFVSDEDTI